MVPKGCPKKGIWAGFFGYSNFSQKFSSPHIVLEKWFQNFSICHRLGASFVQP